MEQKTPLPNHGTDGVHGESRLRDSSFVMSGHHCHSCYELFYVHSGECRFLIEENIYDLRAGDFMLIPPMLLHYTRYLFGPCRRTVVLFREEDVSGAVAAQLPEGARFFAELRVFQAPEAHRAQLSECLSRIVAEERIQDPHSPLLRRLALEEMLLLCVRVCTFLSAPPEYIRTTDPQILRAARFIGQNYMNPISARDIAEAVGFSPGYLSRKFRQAAGIGLHEYLVFVRLHHAALELVSTQDSIITIALRCGFSDSNYFKDSFKKKYGVTPRSYRRTPGLQAPAERGGRGGTRD